MNLRAWLKEFRALFLLFVALPVVLGSAIAYAREPETFSLSYCVLSVVAMMSLHAGTVILNDYFDFKGGTDLINTQRTPYSGGSGLLPAKILAPGQVLAAGLLCFGLSVGLGLFIVLTRSPAVLAVGFAGVVIGLFYTAPPFKLAYRGLGETARFVATPLMVLGAYLVQVPSSWGDPSAMAAAIMASIPVAFLNTGALYIFEFPDYEADAGTNKKNLVVRLGRKNAVYLFVALSALAYLSLLAGILSGLLEFTAAIALIALPLSAVASNGLLRNYDRPKQLIPYMKAASDAYILATAVLIIIYLI